MSFRLNDLHCFDLAEEIAGMKRTAEVLSKAWKFAEVDPLKTRVLTVDGMEVFATYMDVGSYRTVQLCGRYQIFLPFDLVCKVGKMFLGNDLLYKESYTSTVLKGHSRKMYVWRTKDSFLKCNQECEGLRFLEVKF